MRVVAIALGVYNGRRVRVGEEFEVPKGSKATWFVPAEAEAAVEARKPRKPKEPDHPTTFSELGANKGVKFADLMNGNDRTRTGTAG